MSSKIRIVCEEVYKTNNEEERKKEFSNKFLNYISQKEKERKREFDDIYLELNSQKEKLNVA